MTTDPRSKSRGKRIRVKTARGRKASSTRWLARQLNDPYVAEARRLGYRSRSAFKLKEIADKYSVFKKARTIVDLGAAPGGWCQVLRSIAPKAKILAVDLQEMEPLEGVTFIHGDFLDDETFKVILKQTSTGVDVLAASRPPSHFEPIELPVPHQVAGGGCGEVGPDHQHRRVREFLEHR